MENEKDFETIPQEQEQQEPYAPRPKWQIWGARLGLLLFILVIILYYINVARGGV